MPDLDHHLQNIERDGLTICASLIDAALIAQLKAELAPYLQGQLMGRNDFEGEHSERVYALLAKTPSLASLIEHPMIIGLLDALLPPNYLLSAALAINIHPGESVQPFHLDDAAGNPPFPKPRPRFGVSTIWALDDFAASNGATEVIPGSHLWPEDRVASAEDARRVEMSAGSVVVFDGRLIHRGGANNSDNTRLAITPQYCAPWLRQIENMPLAVPPEVAGQYSPRIQSMLGYNVIDPGFMGYVDGVHPRRLIDAAYKGRKQRSGLTY